MPDPPPEPNSTLAPMKPRFYAKDDFKAMFGGMGETSFWKGGKDKLYRIKLFGRKAVVPAEDADALEARIKNDELAIACVQHAKGAAKSVESRRVNPPKRRHRRAAVHPFNPKSENTPPA